MKAQTSSSVCLGPLVADKKGKAEELGQVSSNPVLKFCSSSVTLQGIQITMEYQAHRQASEIKRKYIPSFA